MNSEPTVIADPDLALWTSALLRDRKLALLRLWEISGGQDMHAAAPRAAQLVHAELDREARVRAGQRPRWIDGQVAALAAERAARPEHPGWAEYRRRARASVGRERVTAWEGAGGYAVALRLPSVVWGQTEGARQEPEPVRLRLQIEGYDVAATLGPWVEVAPLDAASWEVEPWIVRATHGDPRDRPGHFGTVDPE